MVTQGVNELQLLQQNLQNFLLQKQQLQTQMNEINSALKGVNKTEKAYYILGNIMVASSKEELLKELNEKKEIIDLRFKNLLKQEENLKEKQFELQKEVIEGMKEKNESPN